MNLSKLELVDLRKIWSHEAHDFTNWLALEENLKLLSDEIGIDISLIQTEATVGDFSADILAEEESTGKKIIIENQLESTDHKHLGQVITYASGVNAEIIIWIVKSVRDEHKQAVDWLNENTNSNINIFAIQIELWKIDNSCAPKFHVIAKPNDWANRIKSVTSQTNRLDFWNKFKEFAQSRNYKGNFTTPSSINWYSFNVGFSKAHISFNTVRQKNQISCEIYIPNSKETFFSLLEHKKEIESALDETLVWHELPNSKASRIALVSSANLSETENWEIYHSWLFDNLIKFKNVFGKYLTARKT